MDILLIANKENLSAANLYRFWQSVVDRTPIEIDYIVNEITHVLHEQNGFAPQRCADILDSRNFERRRIERLARQANQANNKITTFSNAIATPTPSPNSSSRASSLR